MQLINGLADKSPGYRRQVSGFRSLQTLVFLHPTRAHHDHALYTPRHMIKKAFQDKIARVRIGENQYVKVEVWDAAGDT